MECVEKVQREMDANFNGRAECLWNMCYIYTCNRCAPVNSWSILHESKIVNVFISKGFWTCFALLHSNEFQLERDLKLVVEALAPCVMGT